MEVFVTSTQCIDMGIMQLAVYPERTIGRGIYFPFSKAHFQQIKIKEAALPRILRDELHADRSIKVKLVHGHDIYRAIHGSCSGAYTFPARCRRQPRPGMRLDFYKDGQAMRGDVGQLRIMKAVGINAKYFLYRTDGQIFAPHQA